MVTATTHHQTRQFIEQLYDLAPCLPYVMPAVMDRMAQNYAYDMDQKEFVRDIEGTGDAPHSNPAATTAPSLTRSLSPLCVQHMRRIAVGACCLRPTDTPSLWWSPQRRSALPTASSCVPLWTLASAMTS